MSAVARLEQPAACSECELHEFERLVRAGFAGSDETLPRRIRAARWLAFHHAEDDALAAIAGLKAPGGRYCDEVFVASAAAADPAGYELELGWVFVAPEHRGRGIGERLCRQLLARAPASGIFATTRPDNAPMIGILRKLGFARTGRAYPHERRDEELVLFLRPEGRLA